jgi:protein-glutamine gamma-glutamyltransferase
VKYGREKRLWLGGLALLAPLPLPFNDVVAWPVLLLYWAGVGLFLRRADHDVGGWLPNWAMNLLAVVYLPLLFLDLTSLWRGRLLQPVVHLLLYALVIKLFALRRERDKWQALLVVFFLFLAASGTSVHPAIVLHVVAFLAASLALLARFVALDMLARHDRRVPDVERVPLRRFVFAGTVFCVLAAVPLFAFLPRLRSPYVIGPGGGYGALTQVGGFEDEMRLDGIGRVRGSREVALRLTYETPPPAGHEARFKVTTYDRFADGTWSRQSTGFGWRDVLRGVDGRYSLGAGEVASWMGVWMQPFGGAGLAIPVDGLEVDLVPSAVEGFIAGSTGIPLRRDRTGVVTLPYRLATTVRYRVGLAANDWRLAVPREGYSTGRVDLDQGGVTPRIAELAARVMGEGTALDRARRAESYLSGGYAYTTEFVGDPAGERIETFLFDNRRGHCELFASAMVLMLRSQGIAARLATGFLGADYNPIEGYYIVRQSNAHAWVEARSEDGGWWVFDPTPPAGRPAASEAGLSQFAAQLYDYLIFRWDRYVLTYGLADQIGVVASLRDVWRAVSGWLHSVLPSGAAAAPQSSPVAPAAPDTVTAAPEAPPSAPWWPLALLLLLAMAAFAAWQHRRFDASRAYLRLRERLRPELGAGVEAMAPLALVRHYGERFPQGAGAARELVELYLVESFQERRLSTAELGRARRLLRAAVRRRAA